MQFAQRLQNVETSAIRELFKLLGKPGIISFAGGFPDPALFDGEGIAQASQSVLASNPGPDVALCGVTEHVLDAGNAGNSVVWNTGATTGQITVNATGTYSATVTTPAGCQAVDAMHISLDPDPVDMLQDVTSCELTPPTLSAGNPGSTYLWSTAETSAGIVPLTSGTYSVTVTTPQNCSAEFDAVVVLMPRVSVDLGPDLERCAGEQAALDAGPAPVHYLWNTGDTTSVLIVDASGTYILNATNGYCTDSDTAVVTFNPAPVDNLTDQTACIGQTTTFDAGNPGATYAWSSGQTAQVITVSAHGQYAVTITGANGCEASYDADATFVSHVHTNDSGDDQ